MTDKQIDKWLRRRFSPTGWVLLGYYALVNILSLIAMLWEALRQVWQMEHRGSFWLEQMDVDAISGNAWGYIAAIAVIFLILYAWKGKEYWLGEVFTRENPMRPGVFFCLLCFCVGSHMVNSLWISGLESCFNLFDKSLMPMMDAVSGSFDTFSMFLYGSVLAPIAEELLFRGFVLRTLRPYGKRLAIFGSAFLFGLFHGNLLQTPYAFLMGLVLGYATAEYSIGWAIGLHMFNNFVLADLLTRLLAPLPEMASAMIQWILLGGCMVISCVILLVKRRAIAEHIRSEWMDRRVLKCFFTNAGVMVLTVVMILNILAVLP